MLADKVKIEHAWSGMNCRVCSRGEYQNVNLPMSKSHIDGCDLGIQGANDSGYCCLFVPHEVRVKTKRDIVRMVEMHVQRWIREKIAPGE